MTPEQAQYDFDERVGMRMEGGEPEFIAAQAARRQVFEDLKAEGMSVYEASVFVSKLHRWE